MPRYAQTGADLRPTKPPLGIVGRVRSWFRILFWSVVGLIGAFVALVVVLVATGPHSTSSTPSYASPPARKVEPKEVIHDSTPASTPSRGHQESEAEKAYEKKHGVEVVHKKDGTTFERKQAKKK